MKFGAVNLLARVWWRLWPTVGVNKKNILFTISIGDGCVYSCRLSSGGRSGGYMNIIPPKKRACALKLRAIYDI